MNEAIIETPKFSNYKYELKNGSLTLDRPLNQRIPFSYGFVPRTLCADGDGLDVFVISEDVILPNTNVSFLPLGYFKCKDGGVEDNKLVGILAGEENKFLEVYITVIKKYLTSYKKGFEVIEYVNDKNEVQTLIKNSENLLINKI